MDAIEREIENLGSLLDGIFGEIAEINREIDEIEKLQNEIDERLVRHMAYIESRKAAH